MRVQERARKLAAENSDINDEDASKWPHNGRLSRAHVAHPEKVYSNLRQQLKRKPEDKMEDLDVNTLMWGMFQIVTQQAAVHPGEKLAGQDANGGAQPMDVGQIDKSEGEDEDVNAVHLPTRGDPEPPGPRLFGTHTRRAPAWERRTRRVWVKPSKLDPQSCGPG